MNLEYKLCRTFSNNEYTIGKLYENGVYLCDTIEDIEREVKIKDKTAIPKGRYQVIVNMSNPFIAKKIVHKKLITTAIFPRILPHILLIPALILESIFNICVSILTLCYCYINFNTFILSI